MTIINIQPAKYGKFDKGYTNYFHMWTDLIFGLNHCMVTNNIETAKVCNDSPLFTSIIHNVIPNIQIISTFDEHETILYKGRNPHIIEWDNIDKSFHTAIFNKLTSAIEKKSQYILLIKRNTAKRYISNIDTLAETLKTVYPLDEIIVSNLENISFSEQVELFHNAKLIIGQHGAALTNVLWTNPQCVIIEIDKNVGRTHHQNMCTYINRKYYKYAFAEGVPMSLKQKMEAEKHTLDIDDFVSFCKLKY